MSNDDFLSSFLHLLLRRKKEVEVFFLLCCVRTFFLVMRFLRLICVEASVTHPTNSASQYSKELNILILANRLCLYTWRVCVCV